MDELDTILYLILCILIGFFFCNYSVIFIKKIKLYVDINEKQWWECNIQLNKYINVQVWFIDI